jgi:phosphohistidine phosphatase SixA
MREPSCEHSGPKSECPICSPEFTGQKTARQIAESVAEHVERTWPERAKLYHDQAEYWKAKYVAVRRELRRTNRTLEALVWKTRAKEKA